MIAWLKNRCNRIGVKSHRIGLIDRIVSRALNERSADMFNTILLHELGLARIYESWLHELGFPYIFRTE